MSETSQTSSRPQSRLWRYALAAALAWTAVIFATVGWSMFEQRNEILNHARYNARIPNFQKEMLFHFLENGYVGEDVLATNNAPANPRRSRAGERAPITPATLMRQMQQPGLEQPGYRSHLAGLNPLWPENAPDAWETRALQAFEKGATEVSSVEMMAGQEYMRVMRPLVTETACLTCHSGPDEKAGDIRGGMSISVPLAPLWTKSSGHLVSQVTGTGVIWLLGLGVIGFGARRVQVRDRERGKAAEELRKTNDFLETLFNHANTPIIVWDPQFRITRFNHAFESLIGRKAGDVVGGSLAILFPPALAESSMELIRKTMGGERWVTVEISLLRLDGSVRTVAWNSATIFAAAGKTPLAMIAQGQDITERKQAEEAMEQSRAAALNLMEDAIVARDLAEQASAALRSEMAARKRTEESHARLAMAVEHAAEMIVITDANGMILYANPAFEKITGYTREEAIGQNSRVFKSGQHNAEFYRRMWAVLTAGQVWSGDLINKRKNGTLYEEDASISPVFDAAGKIVNYVAVKRDVTEQKKLEAQMLRTQRLESIGTLAGGMAHDLNNALAPIMMCGEMLRLEFPDTASRYLEIIQNGAKRGADMVKQLLTFAKGVEGERLLIQPKHLLNEMQQLITSTFPKSIELRTRYAKDLGTILGDATQLHQMLLNLCVNARDAMPEGGTLTLEAENMELDAAPANTVLEAKPGHYVVWRVTDTGPGIPPEVLNRIFEPLFSITGPNKGTGLGLSTVIGVVKNHGGFVQVHSTPGQGTTFAVYLPVYGSGTDDTSLLTKIDTTFRGHGETILVVDDEVAVCDVLRILLSKLNFEVLTASNGTVALVQVAENRTKLSAVITDLHMPHMDGLSFVRVLKGLLPQTGIIVVSGRLDERETNEFKKLGVNALLDKPFNQETLVAALKTIFQK